MIHVLATEIPITFLCNYFQVSRSGYYSWSTRCTSDRRLTTEKHRQLIKKAFDEFRGRYGSPRIFIYLKDFGIKISENTIAKIMKDEGLVARKKKRFKVVSLTEEINEEVHERVFKIEDKKEIQTNEIWAGDITYIPVDNKFLYLSVVMDLKRRKILGWSIDETLSSGGVTRALNNACKNENSVGSVFHSDQGAQYKSINFRKLLKEKGIQGSMSRKGNCYDNAFVETFFKTLKSELLWNQTFRSEEHLKFEIFEYIESWYNRKRIHSSLDNKSPLEYELEIKAA